MKKILLIICSIFILSGCASFNFSGSASGSVGAYIPTENGDSSTFDNDVISTRDV